MSTTPLWSTPEKLCFSLLRRHPSPPTTTILAVLLRRSPTNLPLFSLLLASSPLPLARRIFLHRPAQDTHLCNTMLLLLVRHHHFLESLSLYQTLLRSPNHPHFQFSPNSHTFPALFKSCSALIHPVGIQLHTHVYKTGTFDNLYVSTALLDMHCKVNNTIDARKVFDEMRERSVYSWTSMIVGYVRASNFSSAMELFRVMPERDVAAYNAVIDGFVKLGDVASARRVFDEMGARNVVTWTSLIHGYCEAGDVDAARKMFDGMPEKNLFSWNVMIRGYCQNRQPERAVELFRELQSGACRFDPDKVTVVSVIPAVGDIGAIDGCRWIHSYVRRKGMDQAANVSAALVGMYAKCGDVCEARRVFDGIQEKGTASWNAMINGLAMNGHAQEALELFMEMLQGGFRPNEITMIGVLCACSHGGLVEEGRRWFREMEVYSIQPTVEHYGCMIDMLGRGGFLEEAERLLEQAPGGANGIMLSSLLFACLNHGDVVRAERVMERVADIEPGNVRNYVMLRNLYAGQQRWKEVERVKELMKKYGGKQEAGCSVIEVENRVSEFVASDIVHPESEDIFTAIAHLKLHMEERGTDELDAASHQEGQ